MKAILVFLIVLLLSISAFAQDKVFEIGVVAGMKLEKFYYQDPLNILQRNHLPTTMYGITGYYQVKPKFAIEFGLNTHIFNNNVEAKNDPYNGFSGGELFIQLPVRLKTQLFQTNDKLLKVEAHTGLSYLYSWSRGYVGNSTILPSFNPIGDIQMSYDIDIASNHALLYELGLTLRSQANRHMSFWTSLYISDGFVNTLEKKGTYSLDNQSANFELNARGAAWNLLLGLNYQLFIPPKTERKENQTQRKKNRLANKQIIIDPYRTLTQFTKRDRLALMVGSPLFFTQAPSTHTGAGNINVKSEPGIMIGLDYYRNYNSKWALHTGLRVGAADYIYSHQIEGESLQINSDLSATYHTPQIMLNVPVGVMRRFPINQKQAFQIEAGLNFYAFGSADVVYFQAEDPNFTSYDDVDLIVDYDINVKPLSATPYLQVGFGTLLKKGNMLQIDFLAQPSISRLMRTEYGFYNNRTQDPNPVGEGTFTSGNGAIALQVSYVFNNLKRQRRKNDLE